MNHADKSNILQHGFRSKRSCETQLIEFIDEVTINMSAGKQTDVLIMDFSKAFDKAVIVSLFISLITTESVEKPIHGYKTSCLIDPKL
jgi:hypothetical protein